MPKLSLLLSLVAASLLPALSLDAASPVVLSGPEVAKLDWNTRSLTTGDINGDGRTDLAVVNNDTGKIEILLQRNPDDPNTNTRRTLTRNRWEPVLDDAPFVRESVLIGHFAYALAVGDLNSDGRADFAYTGNSTPLTVRFQQEEGAWDEQWKYDNLDPEQWVSTVTISDINGDGRNDLGVLGKSELLIFYQNEDNKLEEPKRYKLARSNAHGLQFIDLNGDGLLDVIFLAGNNQYRRIAVRLQQENGAFGPEFGFRMPTGALGLVNLPGEAVPAFSVIEGKTRLIQSFNIEPDTETPDSLEGFQVRDYALGSIIRQAGLYTWGDYDNDGRTDIAVADPSGARILLFRQIRNGEFTEGVPYPSFSNISSISTVRKSDGADTIVVASARERVAGVAEYTPAGRLSFPTLLNVAGEPLAVSAADVNGDGESEIVLLSKQDRKHTLTIFTRKNDEWVEGTSSEVPDVKRDPEGMMTLRLDEDERDDIMLFAPREPARLFISAEDGAFTEVAKDSAVRRTTLNNADSGRLNVTDIDGDGLSEILVGDTGFVRAIAFRDGNLQIVDQFNARSADAVIKGPMLIDLDRDGTRDLLFYDDTLDRLELLKRDQDNVFRSREVNDIGPIDLLQAQVVSLGGKEGGDILLFMGQERFWAIPLDLPGWVKRDIRPSYETDLEDVQYTGLAAGDLNGDGTAEIIAIDGRQNLLEVLAYDEEEGYSSALHFVVFDASMHFSGRSGTLEPREVIVEDVTGDNASDVILLVHDRVLLFTQHK